MPRVSSGERSVLENKKESFISSFLSFLYTIIIVSFILLGIRVLFFPLYVPGSNISSTMISGKQESNVGHMDVLRLFLEEAGTRSESVNINSFNPSPVFKNILLKNINSYWQVATEKNKELLISLLNFLIVQENDEKNLVESILRHNIHSLLLSQILHQDMRVRKLVVRTVYKLLSLKNDLLDQTLIKQSRLIYNIVQVLEKSADSELNSSCIDVLNMLFCSKSINSISDLQLGLVVSIFNFDELVNNSLESLFVLFKHIVDLNIGFCTEKMTKGGQFRSLIHICFEGQATVLRLKVRYFFFDKFPPSSISSLLNLQTFLELYIKDLSDTHIDEYIREALCELAFTQLFIDGAYNKLSSFDLEVKELALRFIKLSIECLQEIISKRKTETFPERKRFFQHIMKYLSKKDGGNEKIMIKLYKVLNYLAFSETRMNDELIRCDLVPILLFNFKRENHQLKELTVSILCFLSLNASPPLDHEKPLLEHLVDKGTVESIIDFLKKKSKAFQSQTIDKCLQILTSLCFIKSDSKLGMILDALPFLYDKSVFTETNYHQFSLLKKLLGNIPVLPKSFKKITGFLFGVKSEDKQISYALNCQVLFFQGCQDFNFANDCFTKDLFQIYINCLKTLERYSEKSDIYKILSTKSFFNTAIYILTPTNSSTRIDSLLRLLILAASKNEKFSKQLQGEKTVMHLIAQQSSGTDGSNLAEKLLEVLTLTV